MEPEAITIKGIRQGLLVSLGEGSWAELLAELERRLDVTPAFFQGGRVALAVGPRALNVEQIVAARDLLDRHNVELRAVTSTNPETEEAARSLGLVIDVGLERRPPPGQAAPEPAEELAFEGLVVRRMLRSGQSLRHPGHIVVIGDVHAGAEIVAGGDVVVWGKLHGVVHAGALGEEGAIVCALDLAPTQLRIAGHIARSPEEPRRRPTPEMASLREGQIVAVPWEGS